MTRIPLSLYVFFSLGKGIENSRWLRLRSRISRQRGRSILGYVTEIVSSVRTPYLGEAFTLTQPWRLLHLSDHVQLRPREGVKKVDITIIQAIGILDDLDKELHTYAMRVHEWILETAKGAEDWRLMMRI
ncbi:probable nucleolar protein 5-2 [Tanacetum coccineum]|uniref:Probable nucleolar protein 5-2 n=1 Tax=Tanacetum coccineum TaxID=301880 RepID=A0ABQ5AI26_9ASTR